MQLGGVSVSELLVEEAVEIRQEIYLAIVVDRDLQRAVMMVSADGGVEIEQVAHDHPEAIAKVESEAGGEYDLYINGERVKGDGVLKTYNPSDKDMVLGTFQKGTPKLAEKAIRTLFDRFKIDAALDRAGVMQTLAKVGLRDSPGRLISRVPVVRSRTSPSGSSRTCSKSPLKVTTSLTKLLTRRSPSSSATTCACATGASCGRSFTPLLRKETVPHRRRLLI